MIYHHVFFTFSFFCFTYSLLFWRVKVKNFLLLLKLCINPLTFLVLSAFLQWQVVTGMEADKIIESLANYVWFLRVPIAVCISHLLLIDRGTPVDL